jgi:hypothetical protein
MAIAVAQADAQSPPSPLLYNGFVPTAGQWNSYFQGKADWPGILNNANVWSAPQTFNNNLTINGSASVVGNLQVTGTLSATVLPLAAQFQFMIGSALNVAAPTTLAGDCVYGGLGIICTKTNLVPFASIATVPSASNLTSGTLSPSLLPAFAGDVASAGASGTLTIQSGVVTNAKLATVPANSWKGSVAGGAPSDNAWTNCNGANSALQYASGTGTLCNASIASLVAQNQSLSGGAVVVSVNLGTLTSGTLSTNCGQGPLQFFTNNGSLSIAAPTNDSSCMILMTNGASAVVPTFSGFSVGAQTGDALTTTNTSKFTLSIWRINGVSGYRVAAHQ